MTIGRAGARCALGATVMALLLLAGCGDAEQDRIDLLTADPGASLAASCDEFLAKVGERTGWSAVGLHETRVAPATAAEAGNLYQDGCHLGVLDATFADADAGNTAYRFVFVSIPTYGTWQLKSIGVVDASGRVDPYEGDTDAFYAVNAEQNRHPDA